MCVRYFGNEPDNKTFQHFLYTRLDKTEYNGGEKLYFAQTQIFSIIRRLILKTLISYGS